MLTPILAVIGGSGVLVLSVIVDNDDGYGYGIGAVAAGVIAWTIRELSELEW
jgi:hypothetical protein